LFEEEWDPYAATPEDALDAARREVKRWRLEQLTHLKAKIKTTSRKEKRSYVGFEKLEAKGVSFKILDMNLDTKTPTGKLLLSML
jgi:DNA invertase Pin-like site-specific DNA recombinase